MKILFLFLGLLGLKTAYAQNTYIYLKNGDKMTVEDGPIHYTWREGLYYYEQKKNGKFASSNRMDISKIEKLEAPGNIEYFPHQINKKASHGFFKTLIQGKGKRFIVCFRPIGSQRDALSINYAIIDDTKNEIVSDLFAQGDLEKQQKMFEVIRKHFPNCNEVLKSMEEFKDIRHSCNFFTGKPPVGFTFQTKVFVCE